LPSVESLQAASRRVGDNALPHAFGLADDDGIGMSNGLMGKERGVNAAEHDESAALAELRGEMIGPGGVGGETANAHKIPGPVEVHALELLLDDLHGVIVRSEALKDVQRKLGNHEPLGRFLVRCDAGRDQQDVHVVFSA